MKYSALSTSQVLKTPIAFLSFLILFLIPNLTYTQGGSGDCNQVEIVYLESDCSDIKSVARFNSPEKPCKNISVCEDNLYTYASSINNTGWTFNWSVTGPVSVTINPNNLASSITIIWPQQGNFILTLTATDPSGNVFTSCINVHVSEKPIANFTFTPNNVCSGSTISFTNTSSYSSGAAAYTWNFGDPSSSNNSSSTQHPTHLYSNAGTFNVTLIACSYKIDSAAQGHDFPKTVNSCCCDTITKPVTILPGMLKIECISTVCAGDTSSYTAIGCINPTWLAPIGGTILSTSGNTITIVWGNGNPQGQIQAQCAGGCIASVPIPIIPANPVIIGNLNPCYPSISSYTLPLLPGTFYTWTLINTTTSTNYTYLINTFPDNNTANINWGLATSGTYLLSVHLENKHLCCSSTGSILITPLSKWTAHQDKVICEGDNSLLFAWPPSAVCNWTVLPILGVSPFLGSGNSFNPIFSMSGNYVVTAIETSTGNFCNSGPTNPQFLNITVIDKTTPGNIIGPLVACVGNTNYIYSMSTVAPPGYYYQWTIPSSCGSFQPGSLLTTIGNAVTINWISLPCTISVVLLRTGFPKCPSVTITKIITQAQIGNITGNNIVCADNVESYSLSGTLPAGEIFNWSIIPSGAGTIISGPPNIMIQWHGNGTGATIMVTSNCGNTSLPVTISLPSNGTIAQTGTNFCQGITLTTSASGSNYIWYLNGSQITGTGNSIIITQGGPYAVTYINSSGCKVTATINVPNANPCQLLITSPGPLVYCIPATVNTPLLASLGAGCTGYSYQWYGPSGLITGANLQTYTATASGSYYVVATNGFCVVTSSTITINIIICPNPACVCIPFSGTFTISQSPTCNPVSFSSTYPGVTWYFGDGYSSSSLNTTHLYSSPGYYQVTVLVPCMNSPCVEVFVKDSVFVPIAPDFNFNVNCLTTTFTDLSQVFVGNGGSITSWFWDFDYVNNPGANTSTSTNPTFTYSGPGTYDVNLTVTYSQSNPTLNCTGSVTYQVIITAPGLPPISITPSPFCTNMPYTFSTTVSNMLNYTWNFGDGFFGYQQSVQHSYSFPGTYTVQLTVSDRNGCTAVNYSSINVLPGIDSCDILPVNFCPGGSATLTGPNITGATYSWQTPSGPAPGVNTNISYITNVPGLYFVIVTAPNGCRCTSNTVEVKVLPKPVAGILASPSTHLCGPGNLFLFSVNHLQGYTSEWYTNGNYGTLLSTSQNYSPGILTVTTDFNLILTNEFGCKDTCTLTVTVDPIPAMPIIVATPTSCEGVQITLSVTNYTNNISWNTGQTTTSIMVQAAGIYTATYTDPVTGCTSSKDYKINRRPPLELFPHFCDTIPCTCRNLDNSFTIYAPLPLVGIFASNYSIQWYFNGNPVGTNGNNPSYSPAISGMYNIVVTDVLTGCQDTSDKYTIVVPECDSCQCGTYDLLYAISRGPLLPVNCGDTLVVPSSGALLPIRFISSFHCNGTNCPDTTKVDWILTGPAGSGFIPLMMNGVNATPGFTIPITNATFTYAGIYTLTITGYCNGKPCPPCIIYFNAQGHACCSSINNADFCSAVMNAVSISVDNSKCKATLNIGNLPKCDSIVSINWGEGPIVNGPFGAGSMLMHTYSGSGTYVISWLAVEYDYSGGAVRICFEKVFTDTIRIRCDSCVCSKSEISLEHNGLAYILGCNNKNLTVIGCPATDIVLSGFFGCVGDSCVETIVSYELQTPSLLIPGFTTNYPQLTFPANLVNEEGIYCLTLTTTCPGSSIPCVCRVCWYQPKCDTCCTNYDLFCAAINNAVSVSTDSKLCKATVNVGTLPACNTIGQINWGDNSSTSGPFTSGAMPMHTYSGSGTYIISWLALEYDYSVTPPKLCFEKLFRDTIVLKCDSCECRGFQPLSFVNLNWPGVTLPVKCGNSYQLPCIKKGQNPLFYFHGNMNCNPDSCYSDSVSWQIVAMPLGIIVASGSTTLHPLFPGAHFDITLNQNWFTANVTYMMTVTGKCGTKICSCKISFRFADCACLCKDLLADVKKGFSVTGTSNSCIRKFTPLGLCPQDKVTWTVTGSGFSIGINPNPTTGNGTTTVTFSPPGGIYYVCMSVSRIDPITGKPCPRKEFCQKVIVKCKNIPSDPTRYFNTCQSNLIKNGDFDSGLEVGQLGLNGKVADWSLFPNQGDGFVYVDDSTGAYDDGHIILIGGKDNFAGVWQKLDLPSLMLDSNTIVDFSLKNYYGAELPTGSVIEFRLQAEPILNSLFEILYQQKIDTSFSGWSSRSFSKKAVTSNRDFKYLVICLQNEDSNNRSVIGIDNLEFCTTDSTLLSTNKVDDDVRIKIFPNPSDGTFIIEMKVLPKPGMGFRITDLTGRSVFEKNAVIDSKIQNIDASRLASGFYLMQVISKGKVLAVEKLMKQ